jgi:NAD+ synthase
MEPSHQDYLDLADRIAAWLRAYAQKAGAPGYVVGLSGGIDSAVVGALCRRAVGDQTLGVLMPCHSIAEDGQMARLVAEAFQIETVEVDLGPTFDALMAALPVDPSHLARANTKPRLRMATLYALAQTRGYLVAGTGNKSELMVGYFTKYGDGGVDLEPLGALYKWQVRGLARALGVPQPIIDRPPSAGIWLGQTDEGEMGITYAELDATLAAIEKGQTDGIEPATLAQVQGMMAQSEHKRHTPPVFGL